MKIFSSKLSLFLIICFWSNSLIAQFNNNNNFNYFPQAFFNKNDAAAKLTKGKSTIQGVAFTRENTNASTAKHYGKNTIVMLFPVTDYLIEWQKLVNKNNAKPNSNVVMDKEAFKYRIETLTDEYGNFTFKDMKPGKYFLQCDINFVGVAADYARTGTIYYGLYTSSPIYEKYFYNYNGGNRHNLIVEIESDGQLKQVKLKPNMFQNYKNIGSQFASTQNCYMKNNLQNGKCNEYNENGTLSAVAEWKDGLQHGETVFYYPNGKIKSSGGFKKGFNSGTWKNFNENGKLSSELTYTYKNDISVLEGPAKYYHPNGMLQAEGANFNKVKKGLWKYYDENGKKASEETYVYKNNTSYIEGFVIIYYPSGKIKEKDVFVNGKGNGEVITYYESGVMQMKAIFKDSVKHGPAIYYNEKGDVTKQENYQNGKLVK